MKKIISLDKEITFPTMIGEIEALEFNNDLSFIKEDRIEGNLNINGTYKMTEASRLTEEFNYSLPVEINLDEKLDLDSATIGIDNFTYEIISDDVLLCKIDIFVEGIEKIDDEEEIIETSVEEEEEILEINEDRSCDGDILEEEKTVNDNTTIDANSLFSNLSDDTFKSYTVYIVRESDTIESIIEKYNITKDELSKYNDLDNITINTKLIIPTANES